MEFRHGLHGFHGFSCVKTQSNYTIMRSYREIHVILA